MVRRGETGVSTIDDNRAQSSMVGVILVIGMVLAGTAVVVALGSAALGDVERQSELERAEHSMTLFNSRAAMVGLGDSPSQQVSFGDDSGSFAIEEDDSWLRITHSNYTGNGDDEVVYNNTLGTVMYRNDGTRIAYQGGGVWRKDREGDAMMISPPEFHYRAATLTLPIVRIANGDDADDGSTIQINRASETRRVFPNATSVTGSNVGAPYNVTGADYHNPVANGTVNITIKSEYFHGWAQYFRSNTEGQVTTFPDKNRVRVTLVSLAGSIGDFQMPSEGNSLEIRGMGDDHPIDTYEITLKPDPHYQNMHWSFYAEEGNEQFELHFYSTGQCTGSNYNGDIDMSVYYYNSSGGATIHEEWQNQSVKVNENPDFTLDCDTGELTVDLMSSTPMAYGDISLTGSNNKWLFGPEIDSRSIVGDSTSFDIHGPDSGQYEIGDEANLGFVVNHYFQLLGPQYDLTITDGPGGSSRVDESESSGRLVFDTSTGSQYITYLHVTENDIDVTVD